MDEENAKTGQMRRVISTIEGSLLCRYQMKIFVWFVYNAPRYTTKHLCYFRINNFNGTKVPQFINQPETVAVRSFNNINLNNLNYPKISLIIQ